MLVCGAGAGPVNSEAPSVVELLIVVRTSFARRVAPSMFSWPAPCSNMFWLGSCWAVYINNVLIKLGVRDGLASNKRAAAPATSGAAIDVPLSIICLRVALPLTLASSEGFCERRKLFGDCAKIVLLPGAEISGFIKLS